MEPIFPKWTNRIPLYAGVGVSLLLIAIVAGIWYYFSPKFLAVGYEPDQPIAFSHQLHAGQMGIDCSYCHVGVEKTSFSPIPPTDTCMGCHNKVKKDSPRLKVLRESYENKTPIPWVRVHALPRYSHFDHSAHLTAGVGCVTCHDRVDKMQTVRMASPLSMGWCLDCHRNPLPNIRPQSELKNMIYNPHTEGYDPLKDPDYKDKLIQGPQACGACHY
ncbi:cytochrome c3 family protein [Fluviispira sanaruensis]|uniref:Cytochrome c n=1 Tax=Fluviispira sanaruensis TaxID=2493639 RepID=A0A4P2VXZ3_FLUSA|nr:cytochrome c3 family protein [Fluviispira sanaruensis]BBH54535.1 cytochrome c [Fluviispira sanaruensis]